ncbi:hypothetical protein ONS95_013290 [Cadophora gregata]|uniref:uncharacterized protein n=1 Tax=Cadophora gregata TaxID=51156 RepID=UPI0026DD528D|nr:uncharacterized protein ONS95_013290 [Cadophora gregata]KAK0099886.1 hypothetical protein ONS96_007835 [Cadophora gregata f. sp. sojae]KAK0116264.1 hypothetical protein ONS95_013290 [Cadophora gregata]
MKSTAFSVLRRNGATSFQNVIRPQYAAIRYLSTKADIPAESPSLQTTLHAELTSRPRNTSIDYISPIPWNLLNISLADFLPSSCQPRNFNPAGDPTDAAVDVTSTALPQGHHLVYFPPPVPDSSLLRDGTDSLHSPGAPFVKRLWGGGSIVFSQEEKFQIVPKKLAVCGEEITDVNVKGVEGQEKVFVTVTRRILSILGGYSRAGKRHKRQRRKEMFLNMDTKSLEQRYGMEGIRPWAVIEERNLVFMREKSTEEARDDLEKVGKIVKPPHTPDFSVSLRPNAALLFRFSALSFNAHRIHLDPQYTREVEGHRNLLVHGPLTIVLMLSVLRSQITGGKMVVRFDYRNLAPLYVDEEMRICVRRDPERENKLDVWVEGRDGGLAVKGTAIIGDAEFDNRR